MVDLPDDASQAQDLVVDTFGRIIEFWGFTRTMGRVFGLLYLSPEALTLQDICDRLSISAGNASMTLNGLLRWGVVRKVWVKGERRDFYEGETDFWKMISGVLNERERREIGAAVEVVQRAESGARAVQAGLRGSATPASRRLKVDADFAVARLARLHEICRLGETMLDMLLGQLTLDVGRFRDVLKVEPPPPPASPSPGSAETSPPAQTGPPRKSEAGDESLLAQLHLILNI